MIRPLIFDLQENARGALINPSILLTVGQARVSCLVTACLLYLYIFIIYLLYIFERAFFVVMFPLLLLRA